MQESLRTIFWEEDFFTWQLWKTDVSYRFTIWMAFFLPPSTGRRGESSGGEQATLSWPFCHMWCHMTPDTQQRSRAKANTGQMIWRELSQRGEASFFHKEGKWNSTQQRNKSFDQCEFWKVSFRTDWCYKHLKFGLIPLWDNKSPFKLQDEEQQDVIKEKNTTK